MYDCYFTNVLTQRSCFEVPLTADSQCFTRDDARIRTDDPLTKTGVHCELEHRGLRSLRAVWSIFSHQAPPSPVSSICQPISTAIPVALAFNNMKPALSSIAVVSKAFKHTARISLCRVWEHPQRCFPPFGQKPRKA